MTLIKCSDCGKEFSSNAESCPNCGNPKKEKEVKEAVVEKKKGTWSTTKLIIGIISMVLFVLIAFQSCAVGIGNVILENDSSSGAAGFICAFLILVGGIVCVATRNSKGKGGSIACIIIYWLASLLTIGNIGDFADLSIWASVALIFGLINLCSIIASNIKEKQNHTILVIITIITSIVVFSIGIFLGGISSLKNGDSINSSTNDSYDLPTQSVDDDSTYDNNDIQPIDKDINNKKSDLTLGDTFIFDDLEITLGTDITFTKVNNRFSDYNGKDVVKLPITVKNLTDETHGLNMFYYEFYGSQGTEVENVASYFKESIDYAGDLRSGASYTKYMYFIYDGNGEYAIEFDNYSEKINVVFDINK